MMEPLVVQSLSTVIAAIGAWLASIIVAYIQASRKTQSSEKRILLPTGINVKRRFAQPIRWIVVSTLVGAIAGYLVGGAIAAGMFTSSPATATTEPGDTLTIAAEEQLIFGPISGTLKHEAPFISFDYAHITLKNFTAEAVFYNPYLIETQDWDFGIAFRIARGKDYRLIVSTRDEAWFFWNDLDDKHFEEIVRGKVTNLDLSPAGANRLTLAAFESTGCFSINGRLIAELDLSDLVQPGDIGVGVGFFTETHLGNATTAYEEFTVYHVDSLDCR